MKEEVIPKIDFYEKICALLFYNILIYSRSLAAYAMRLHEFFTILAAYAVHVDPKKWSMGNAQMEFLGPGRSRQGRSNGEVAFTPNNLGMAEAMTLPLPNFLRLEAKSASALLQA